MVFNPSYPTQHNNIFNVKFFEDFFFLILRRSNSVTFSLAPLSEEAISDFWRGAVYLVWHSSASLPITPRDRRGSSAVESWLTAQYFSEVAAKL